MASERLRKRLISVNAIFEMLTLRRVQSGDPQLGAGMERRILESELTDLEKAMTEQESLEDAAERSTRTDL
ncbi:MAG TPA: hypothetical protein VNY30_20535 [Bryobacteraceae bacterium]|jgi:hypothetical protein|nr:hypothetical protein [Bryobacteraceae bacterium]